MKACKDCRWWVQTISAPWGRCWLREVYQHQIRSGKRVRDFVYVPAVQRPCGEFTEREVQDEHSGHRD
jgi:hypothetical protein